MAKGKKTKDGYSPRNVNTREVKPTFLIVCEGTKTEPNYFKRFRVPSADVRGFGANPSNVVKYAEKLNREEKYDQVWCVFDRDDFPANDFDNAIFKAESLGFHVAYSNEAFELWYILHFEFLNSAYSRHDYGGKLTTHLGHKYEKNSETIYEELFNLQSKAIKHAESLLRHCDPPNPGKDNPSTTVHLLVIELNNCIS